MFNSKVITIVITLLMIVVNISVTFVVSYEYYDFGRLIRAEYSNKAETRTSTY